ARLLVRAPCKAPFRPHRFQPALHREERSAPRERRPALRARARADRRQPRWARFDPLDRGRGPGASRTRRVVADRTRIRPEGRRAVAPRGGAVHGTVFDGRPRGNPAGCRRQDLEYESDEQENPMSVQDTIREQVTGHPVVLYMKGSPQMPMCGFSATATQLLRMCGADQIFTVDV